jgi:hypothetical protein
MMKKSPSEREYATVLSDLIYNTYTSKDQSKFGGALIEGWTVASIASGYV